MAAGDQADHFRRHGRAPPCRDRACVRKVERGARAMLPARRRRGCRRAGPAISSTAPDRMFASMPRSRASRASTGSVACGPRKPMRRPPGSPGVASVVSRFGDVGRQRAAGFVGEEGAGHLVLRPGEDVEHVALLDDAPALDHRDLAGDVADHRHLVGDQQDGQAELAVDAREQLEDRAGGLRVERRGRLVGEQHLRLGGQRAGDADALLLAAGELGRIAVALVGEADEIEQLVDPRPGSPPCRSPRSRAAARCSRRPCARTAG